MTVVKYLFWALAIGSLVVIVPWLTVFYGDLSREGSDWANFGSYIGGTYGSLVAAMALIALLYTIYQQHKQIEILRYESSKKEILHAIQSLESDLEKVLDQDIRVNFKDRDESIKAKDLLFKISSSLYVSQIPNESEIKSNMKDIDDNDTKAMSKILMFELYGVAAAEINQIRLYLIALQKIEQKQGTNLLTRYYDRKYSLAAKRLYERKLLKENWKFETEKSNN